MGDTSRVVQSVNGGEDENFSQAAAVEHGAFACGLLSLLTRIIHLSLVTPALTHGLPSLHSQF